MVYCLMKKCGSDTNRLHKIKCNYDLPPPDWMKYVTSSARYKFRKFVRICSIHFTDDQFKPRSKKRYLIDGAVPTLYLDETPPRFPDAKKLKKEGQQKQSAQAKQDVEIEDHETEENLEVIETEESADQIITSDGHTIIVEYEPFKFEQY